MRRFVLLALLLCPVSVLAQQHLESRLRKELSDVQSITNDLVREAQRDAEVLRFLLEANRALDDWQMNKALDEAMERIGRAEQIAMRPPVSNPQVRQSVRVAKEIVAPAQDSPTTADLQKVRDELNRRPISWMREVVTEEMHGLAMTTTMLSDAASLLAKALAGVSASTVRRQE